MSRPVHILSKRAKIDDIAEALRDTNHNGFPIVDNNPNGDQRLLGIITRNTLMVILQKLHLVPDCAKNTNLHYARSSDDKFTDFNEVEGEMPTHSHPEDPSEDLPEPSPEQVIPWTEFTEDF